MRDATMRDEVLRRAKRGLLRARQAEQVRKIEERRQRRAAVVRGAEADQVLLDELADTEFVEQADGSTWGLK